MERRILTIQAKLRSSVDYTVHSILKGNLLPRTNVMIDIITAAKLEVIHRAEVLQYGSVAIAAGLT